MKTILAPTDFSPAAASAVNYAAELCYRTGSRLVLMHVFHIPVPSSEFPVVMPSINDLEEGHKKHLQTEAERIQSKYHHSLSIDTIVRCGMAVDEITDVAKEEKADLVVAGMQGGGFVERRLLGSVTTTLMQKLHCPVLSVDAEQQFTPPDKIVVACDLEFLSTTKVLQPLLELRRLFNSHLLLLHITDNPDQAEHAGEAAEKLKIELKIGSVPHSWHTLSSEDFAIALNAFVAAEQAGWVVMMPRKHNWLSRLLKESHTTEMAYKSHVPLLAVHAE
ncbi:MAG: universal stress protein [Bacteroidia bacterium]|jgi:nucleotide-binding universal stress UspA family protein|nr:universal stress protein [Bacteroidia bacterium]